MRSAVHDPSGGLRALGEYLREMREDLALTQDQLAEKTRALRRPVSRAAISALEQGKHAPTAATVVAICRALHIDPREVIDRLELASIDAPDSPSADPRALEGRLDECIADERFHEALDLLGTLIDRARREPQLDPATRDERIAEWTLRRARVLASIGAPAVARNAAERVLALSQDGTDRQVEAYLVLADAHLDLGNLPLALDAAQRAVEQSSLRGRPLQVRARLATGRLLRLAHRHEDARQAYLAARERVSEADDRATYLECEGNVGTCLLDLGRGREAHMKILQCVERARRQEMPAEEARWLVELGRVALLDGRLGDARRHADAALGIARRCEHWPIVFAATLLRHRIVRRADPDDPDRRRAVYLRRILDRLRQESGDRDLRELRRELSG